MTTAAARGRVGNFEEVNMTQTLSMLDSSPADIGFDAEALATCIDACFECAQTCSACADSCLAESNVTELRRCITLDLNCADVCMAAGRALSRQTEYAAAMTAAILEACAESCRLCGDECSRHGDHMRHCQLCAEACRRCEQACRQLLAAASQASRPTG